MANALLFRESDHKYFLNDRELPSVTTVMSGVITDYSRIPHDVLKAAQERGIAVHKMCELADLGTLDYTSIDEPLWPYLEAWRAFKHQAGFKCEWIEQRVYSDTYGYAGTFDRFGLLGGKPALVDIKSGAPIGDAAGIQLAAYEAAGKERGVLPRKLKRFSVHLQDNGNYKLIEYTNPADLHVFYAALTIFNYRRRP